MKSKKGVEKRVVLGILLIGIFVISVSFVSASWWGDLFGGDNQEDLEGELAEQATARVKIEDVNPPIVVYVSNVQDGKGTPDIVTPNNRLTLNGNISVTFSFLAQQGGGVGNLNATPGSIVYSNGTFSRAGSTTRLNSTCRTLGQVACGTLCSGNAVNYSCTIVMRYYDDPAATWVITATAKDLFNRIGINSTKQFTVASVSAASSAINYLNWTSPPLTTTDTNRYSDNNYMVDNDGNTNIPTTSVNATNLTGLTNPAFVISATKFTANPANPGTCGGTTLGHGTNPPIAGFSVPKATTDAGSQEQLHFCLMDVAGLSSQEYNGSRSWIVTWA